MKITLFILVVFIFIITSCQINEDINDIQDSGNYFKIQNDKFELKNAVLRNDGYNRFETFYEGSRKYLFLASEGITFDKIGPCGEIQGIGDFIVWEIYTKSEYGLDEGTYSFFKQIPNLNGKILTFSGVSTVALNWVNPTYDGGAEESYEFIGG